jgi:tetratricopeptide (TPR) repeat protein
MRGQRLAAESPSLIAAGQFDEAENHIERALRSFSLFRSSKVMSLHHLALLKHVQKHWRETAALCRALLKQRPGTLRGLAKITRLLLADALLELNDLPGAYASLAVLYHEHLSLGEAVNLLAIQLDYESRIGAWETMLPRGAIYKRVQLPAETSARAQALMALAAMKTGQHSWADWLRARAQLLADPTDLINERPLLSKVWTKQV